MYETLTVFIPVLKNIEMESDRTQGQKINLTYEDKDQIAGELINVIWQFSEDHPEFGLRRYADIIEENGLRWERESMENAVVDNMDGRGVMTLLYGAFRGDHMCEGTLVEFCKNGCIVRWLERLKEIDNEGKYNIDTE